MIALDRRGHGEPLVLLHGLGADRSIWGPATRWLARDHEVVAPDLPGFGESAMTGGWSVGGAASAVAAEVEILVGSRFDLVGNSLGGAVAIALAAERPELVRRLVLVAPGGLDPAPAALAALAGRLAPLALDARALLGAPLAGSRTARRLLLWGAVAAPERLTPERARTMLRAASRATSLGPALRQVMTADLRPALAGLEVPVGFVWGERDRVVSLAATRPVIGERPLEVIPGGGHAVQAERPAAFAAALERVLNALEVTA